MEPITQNAQLSAREELLRREYGDLLTLPEIAKVFRFPSVPALRKAIARGQLDIPIIRFPKRRGLFASARSVAALLNQIETESYNK